MGQALYRTYRSKSLAEIVGQKPIVTALTNALKSGNISHAYLFTGPRGVGKTSIARILAYEINGLDYVSDELPLDIIEVDAASNRGIDEIRLLRERVHIAPVSSKKKIYIIDEVHMLTSQAFNALLKTLEEPPEHVVFILATTEAHKLPETIVSRTQRYSFKLATQEEVVAHLKRIATKEKIDIDPLALQLVAKHSGGSLRDALSLLDQVRHTNGHIDLETVRVGLGLPSDERVSSVLDATLNSTSAEILTEIKAAHDDGISSSQLASQCLSELRGLLESSLATDTYRIVELMKELLHVTSSEQPDTELELALIGFNLRMSSVQNTPAKSEYSPKSLPTKGMQNDKPSNTAEPAPENHIPSKNKFKVSALKEKVQVPKETDSDTETIINNYNVLTPELWASAMEHLRVSSNTIYGVLRMAEANFDRTAEKKLVLFFTFPFHQKRISDTKNKQTVIEALDSVGITGYEVICEITPKTNSSAGAQVVSPVLVKETPPVEENALIQQIRNVFGGAEVLD